MKNLKDFISSHNYNDENKNFSQEESSSFEDLAQNINKNDLKNNVNENVLSEAGELYEKYKNYSKEDLEKEFLLQSRKKLANGELDKQKLSSTFSTLSPFLNETQKKFLSGVLEKLDE